MKRSVKVSSDTSLIQGVEGVNKPTTKQEKRERPNIEAEYGANHRSNTTLVTHHANGEKESSGKIMQSGENQLVENTASSGGRVVLESEEEQMSAQDHLQQ